MNILADLRKGKGLTQKNLAIKIGLSTSTIAMYESGKRKPDLKKAKLLADFFNVHIEDIFFNNDAHITRANTEQSA